MTDPAKDAAHQHGVMDGWICVGAFAGSHGVRGDVRVKSFTQRADHLFRFKDLRFGPDGAPVTLKKVRTVKDGFIATASNVTTREQALAIKGKKLFVARHVLADNLPADEFYLADLIGLTVRDLSGDQIGIVRSVENFGAEDLIEVILDTPVKGLGRFGFIPFRKALVPDVDIAAGYVTVDLDAWLSDQLVVEGEKSEG